MKKKDCKNGFTLIEVALVLGIAGLIFMMIFIALPALQKQANDSKRKDDMATLISAIKDYQKNNRGALPSSTSTDWKSTLAGYLTSDFSDPDGESYNLTEQACGNGSNESPCTSSVLDKLGEAEFPNGHKVYIVRSATCDGETVKKTANPRTVAVAYKLQGVGVYCINT